MHLNNNTAGLKNKYNITNRKKEILHSLELEAARDACQLQQCMAIESSLTEKSSGFQQSVTVAESNLNKALDNKKLFDTVLQNALELQNQSIIANSEMQKANEKTIENATLIKELITALICTAGLTGKLANMMIRKAAANQLISGEMLTMVTAAEQNASNAVALTLHALTSCFAALAANIESASIVVLNCEQSIKLYQSLTGNSSEDKKADPASWSENSPGRLIYKAVEKAKKQHAKEQIGADKTAVQLGIAQSQLSNAHAKLNSTESGLAAAHAAALAS